MPKEVEVDGSRMSIQFTCRASMRRATRRSTSADAATRMWPIPMLRMITNMTATSILIDTSMVSPLRLLPSLSDGSGSLPG